jgi:hypothetical protein
LTYPEGLERREREEPVEHLEMPRIRRDEVPLGPLPIAEQRTPRVIRHHDRPDEYRIPPRPVPTAERPIVYNVGDGGRVPPRGPPRGPPPGPPPQATEATTLEPEYSHLLHTAGCPEQHRLLHSGQDHLHRLQDRDDASQLASCNLLRL